MSVRIQTKMAQPKPYTLGYRDLSLQAIERDPNQPRRNFGTGGDENRLLLSIREHGLQQPLIVSEVQANRYVILDGHRRYICAQKLNLSVVPCRIYPKLPSGLFESLRYEIQNNLKPWKPLERAEALRSIKDTFKFENNKQLASHLHLSLSTIASSMQLAKERGIFLELMASYGLSETYQIQFLHLKRKLRKIEDLEVDDIIRVVFEKVRAKVIRSAKEFMILGNIFKRAAANEDELYRFLKAPEITVNELRDRSVRSGNSPFIEQLILDLARKAQTGVVLTAREKTSLAQLFALLKKIL